MLAGQKLVMFDLAKKRRKIWKADKGRYTCLILRLSFLPSIWENAQNKTGYNVTYCSIIRRTKVGPWKYNSPPKNRWHWVDQIIGGAGGGKFGGPNCVHVQDTWGVLGRLNIGSWYKTLATIWGTPWLLPGCLTGRNVIGRTLRPGDAEREIISTNTKLNKRP